MLKRHRIATVLALSALTLVALSASFRSPDQAAKQAMSWEFLIETDVTLEQVQGLAEKDWEFVGYLGESVAGDRVNETLWKRPAR